MNAYRGNLVNAPSQNSFMLLARSLMQEQQKTAAEQPATRCFFAPRNANGPGFPSGTTRRWLIIRRDNSKNSEKRENLNRRTARRRSG